MRTLTYAVALLLVIAGVLLLLLAPPIHAQLDSAQAATVDPQSLHFDAVSIKRSAGEFNPAHPTMIVSPLDSDQIVVRNATVRMILGEACGIRLHDLILGVPSWADSESYDIDAKVSEADVPAFRRLLPMQRNPMMLSFLIDRFHLAYHMETRMLPAYALIVGKGGPRLKRVEPGTLPNGLRDLGSIDTGRNQMTATGVSMQTLAHALQSQLGRPVIDRTGLTGFYDFKLRFAPFQSSATSDADAEPSIFTSIQEQLGLRLEAVKAPIQVVVVDHIERPTGN